jgi:gamma-glutamyltranspeptidase/glutathione hydrolase
MPPPTQGLVALGMLARLVGAPAAELRPGPEFARRLRRLRDVTYVLRDRYIADPLFAAVAVEPFLDPLCEVEGSVRTLPEGDTIHLCTADEHGNLVSLTQSVAYSFGSGIVAETTGVLLQNRGCYFSLDPGDINRLEPRKRTMHTLIPAMAGRGGRQLAAFGNMGGEGQPQIETQVAVNLLDLGLDAQAAVSAPRIRVAPGGRKLWIEADYPDAVAISREGGEAELLPSRDRRLGHAQAVILDGRGGWQGGADPRSDGSVEVV